VTTLPLPLRVPSPRRGGPAPLVAALAALVAVACLAPPVYLLVRAADDPAAAAEVLLARSTLELTLRTLVFAGAVTFAAAAIALPLAWLVERTDLPGRRAIGILASLPLAVPSYVGALAFLAALGPRGLLQQALSPLGVERLPAITGFWGATLVLTLFTYPYLLMTLRPALAAADPRLEELSRSFGFGRWTTFRRLVLPQLRPALLSGALLIALYTLSDFGGPTLMRFDSFTRVLFLRYESTFDRSGAAALAGALAALALVIVALEVWTRGRRRYDVVRGHARPPAPVPLGRWRWPALAFVGGVLALALVLPVGVLGYWLARAAASGIALPGVWVAALDSVAASALAALVTTLAAVPVAVLSVRFRDRLFSRAVEVLAYTGYALPGLVVALALVFAAINVGWLYQTLALLVLAYALLFLPQAVGTARVSLLQVRPSMEEAARGLGRRPREVFTSVTVPLSARGLLAGAALVFLTTMKELPATLILAPPGFRTLATRVWSATSDARFAEASLPALTLITISALALAVMHYAGARR